MKSQKKLKSVITPEELIKFRGELGLNREELAVLLGYSYSQLGNLEKGRQRITSKFVKILEEKTANLKKVIPQDDVKNNTTIVEAQHLCPTCNGNGFTPSAIAEHFVPTPEQIATMEKWVRGNNEMLNKVLSQIASFAQGVKAINAIQGAVTRQVQDIVDQQTRALMTDYKNHINAHAYVIHATLSVIVTLIQNGASGQNNSQVLELIHQIMERVDNMMVK